MENSVGALQFIHPSWNKVERGNRLSPSLIYALGIRQRRPEGSVVESKKKTSGQDDIEEERSEEMFALMTEF